MARNQNGRSAGTALHTEPAALPESVSGSSRYGRMRPGFRNWPQPRAGRIVGGNAVSKAQLTLSHRPEAIVVSALLPSFTIFLLGSYMRPPGISLIQLRALKQTTVINPNRESGEG